MLGAFAPTKTRVAGSGPAMGHGAGAMGLAVAIQMDPIDTINIDADSTFALALEAQARNHALFHYLPDALTLRDGRLYARGRPLEVFRRHGRHHRFGSFEDVDLAGV